MELFLSIARATVLLCAGIVLIALAGDARAACDWSNAANSNGYGWDNTANRSCAPSERTGTAGGGSTSGGFTPYDNSREYSGARIRWGKPLKGDPDRYETQWSINSGAWRSMDIVWNTLETILDFQAVGIQAQDNLCVRVRAGNYKGEWSDFSTVVCDSLPTGQGEGLSAPIQLQVTLE